ncbi:MAG: NAD(P)H-hydrate epimerase, partial [Dorea sp.]
MRYLPNSKQMKEADRYTIQEIGVPSLELMERAAASCVDVITERIDNTSNVCIVCGSGNNGGDGFAIARMLVQKGYNVTTVMAGNPGRCTEETKVQIEQLEQTGAGVYNEIPDKEYSIIIDALFGVGLSRL